MRKFNIYPEDGEIRWKKCFALLPVAIDNEIAWMCHYYQEQKFVRHYGDLRNFGYGFWIDV